MSVNSDLATGYLQDVCAASHVLAMDLKTRGCVANMLVIGRTLPQ